MEVTIVASEFPEETRDKFREEVNKLLSEDSDCIPHKIQSHLSEKYKIAVSIGYDKEKVIIVCHPNR